MKNNIEPILRKIIAGYLFLGSLFFIVFFLYQYGLSGILSSFLSALLTFGVLIFFCIGSLYVLRNKVEYQVQKNILIACLLIQSFGLRILGLSIRIFFGPDIAIGFTDTPAFQFRHSFGIFVYDIINGIKKGSSEISVMVNLIPLAVLILWLNLKPENPYKDVEFLQD